MTSIDRLLQAANLIDTDQSRRTEARVEEAAKRRHNSKDFHPYAKRHRPIRPKDDKADERNIQTGGLRKRANQRRSVRAVHNKLEKNRRAHMKECFECLQDAVPSIQGRKLSNLSILRCGKRYIEVLKKKEVELKSRKLQLLDVNKSRRSKVLALRKEICNINPDFDFSKIEEISQDGLSDEETKSDSTDTADESPIMSDEDITDIDGNLVFRRRKILPNGEVLTEGNRYGKQNNLTIKEQLELAEARKKRKSEVQFGNGSTTSSSSTSQSPLGQTNQVQITNLSELPHQIQEAIKKELQKQQEAEKKAKQAEEANAQSANRQTTLLIPAASIPVEKTAAQNHATEMLLNAINMATSNQPRLEVPKQSVLNLPVQNMQSINIPQLITSQQLANLLPSGNTVQLKSVLQPGTTIVTPKPDSIAQTSQTVPTLLQIGRPQKNSIILVPTSNGISSANQTKPNVNQLLQKALLEKSLAQQLQKSSLILKEVRKEPAESQTKTSLSKAKLGRPITSRSATLKVATFHDTSASPSDTLTSSSMSTSPTHNGSNEIEKESTDNHKVSAEHSSGGNNNAEKTGLKTPQKDNSRPSNGDANPKTVSSPSNSAAILINQQNSTSKESTHKTLHLRNLAGGTSGTTYLVPISSPPTHTTILASLAGGTGGNTAILAPITANAGTPTQLISNSSGRTILQQVSAQGTTLLQPINTSHPALLQQVSTAGTTVLQPVSAAGATVLQPVSAAGATLLQSASGATVLQPVSAAGTTVLQPISTQASTIMQRLTAPGTVLQRVSNPIANILQQNTGTEATFLQPVTSQASIRPEGFTAVNINGVRHIVPINQVLAAGQQTANLSHILNNTATIQQRLASPNNQIQIAVPITGNSGQNLSSNSGNLIAIRSLSDLQQLQSQMLLQQQTQQQKQVNLQNVVLLAPSGGSVQNGMSKLT